MQSLNPAQFPLHGIRLIEASAGTGKTYTISSLYLRVLLERELGVDRILLVTFTRAATEELHARIRARLSEAIAVFKAGVHNDAFYQSLIKRVEANRALELLRAALLQMDEAAIYTIHGYCQRALQENAFESGELFQFEFREDDSPLVKRAVEDCWRRHFYACTPALAEFANTTWGTPDGLREEIKSYLGHRTAPFDLSLSELSLEDLERAFHYTLDGLRLEWHNSQADLIGLLQDHPGLDRNRYRSQQIEQWLRELGDYLASTSRLFDVPQALRWLAPGQLERSTRDGHTAPEHPAFSHCGRLYRLAKALPGVIRRTAIVECRHALDAAKRQSGELCYDDLVTRLAQDLSEPGGKALAARLQEQYPVAMIDEFQDTDAEQYGIFKAIYDPPQNDPTTTDKPGLFLIGDPKQSIYSFRGADVFAYIRARRASTRPDHLFTLDTNWRSSRPMVAAVNALFGQAEAPFIFDDDIPFTPVAGAGEADATPLCIGGEPASPLHVWFIPRQPGNQRNAHYPDPYAQGDPPRRRVVKVIWARSVMARQAADEIRRLLEDPEARIGDRRVRPGDIAILVRDRYEGKIVQDALRRLGVNSVFLNRDSVYQTEEARELARLMRAVANPGDDRAIRAALATQLLGGTAESLEALRRDDLRWERELDRFAVFREHWQQRGFLALYRELSSTLGIDERLLQTPDGERRVTNLRHLAELIAEAATEQSGLHALTNWFCRQCSSEVAGEEQELRLESDIDLVQIVTQHKSKGLQYAIVFLPFIWRGRGPDDKTDHFLYHDEETGLARIELGSNRFPLRRRQFYKEALAESIRLLYVAVTRARYRCYIAWGQVFDAPYSALAYLLHQPSVGEGRLLRVASLTASLSDDAIWQRLEALCDECGGTLSRLQFDQARPSRRSTIESDRNDLDAAVIERRIEAPWRLHSFSSILAGAKGHADNRNAPIDPEFGDDQIEETDKSPLAVNVSTDAIEPEWNIFTFPRGARAGTCLHEIFEAIDFTDTHGLSEIVEASLTRYGFATKWCQVIERMVDDVLQAQLDAHNGCRLDKISNGDRLSELEFHFPLSHLDMDALAPLLTADARQARPRLAGESILGMMKGFIDLVFRYQGRYYIVDYKSNHLGDRLEDYQEEHLKTAIAAHYYDLQFLIYTVALHRYLGRRIEGYDYRCHFGGVCYLFLRGMRAAGTTGVYAHKPELDRVLALDRLFADAAAVGEVAQG